MYGDVLPPQNPDQSVRSRYRFYTFISMLINTKSDARRRGSQSPRRKCKPTFNPTLGQLSDDALTEYGC